MAASNSKPTEVPEFNSGGANKVAPNVAKKILGWVLNEIPPSSTLNWISNVTWQWLKFLDDRMVNLVHQTAAGRLYLALRGDTDAGGIELSTSAADADQAVVGEISFADKNNVTDADPDVVHLYGRLNGATGNRRGGKLEIAVKANNGNGHPTVVSIDENAATITALIAATGTFSGAVSASTYGAVVGTTGAFSGAVTAPSFAASGDVSGATGTFSGNVSAPNAIRAFGRCQGQGASAPNNKVEHNLSFSRSSNSTILVTLSPAMADTNYVPVATLMNAGDNTPVTSIINSSSFSVQVWNTTSNSAGDSTSFNIACHVLHA